jgi:hypothetical protein
LPPKAEARSSNPFGGGSLQSETRAGWSEFSDLLFWRKLCSPSGMKRPELRAFFSCRYA